METFNTDDHPAGYPRVEEDKIGGASFFLVGIWFSFSSFYFPECMNGFLRSREYRFLGRGKERKVAFKDREGGARPA